MTISRTVICNPMSVATTDHRSVLDPDCHCNNRQNRLDGNSTLNILENTICALREVIHIRGCY